MHPGYRSDRDILSNDTTQSWRPPKVVSERLGHANISITLDTYSHVIPSLQQEVADVVADLVSGYER